MGLRWYLTLTIVTIGLSAQVLWGREHHALSVSDYQKRERVGAVFINSSNGSVYAEIVSPASSFSGPLPYTDVFSASDARKKIMRVGFDIDSQVTPLFPQQEEFGYWFAGDMPQSPNGRYWSIVKQQNGRIFPGVFDSENGSARFFDYDLAFNYIHSPTFWSSDSELVVHLSGDSTNSFDPVVMGARRITSAREASWLHRETSVSVLVADAPKVQQATATISTVAVLDIHTGSMRKLFTGRVGRPLPSADGRRFDGLIYRSFLAKKGEMDLPSGETEHRRGFLLGDIESGETVEIWPSVGFEFGYFLNWSENSENFVVQVHDVGTDNESVIHFEVRNWKGEFLYRLPTKGRSPFWVGETLIYRVWQEGHTPKWKVRLSESNTIDLTERLPGQTGTPIAVGDDTLFFLSSGDVWSVSVDGNARNITGEFSDELTLVRPSSSTMSRYLSFVESQQRLDSAIVFKPPAIDGILLSPKQTENEILIKITQDGRALIFDFEKYMGGRYIRTNSYHTLIICRSTTLGTVLKLVTHRDSSSRAILELNTHMIGKRAATGPIRLSYTDRESNDVASWLYLPPNVSRESRDRFPLIILPYPGKVVSDRPPDFFVTDSVFELEPSQVANMEILASKGYAILVPNIRLLPPGTADEPARKIIDDTIMALDAAKDTGLVDTDRVAVVGHSYGGYAALVIARRSDRIKAAVASAPLSNLSSEYGVFARYLTVDASSRSLRELSSFWMLEDGQDRMGAAPWEDPGRYERNSPLFFADNIDTPVLLVHGDLDFVSVSQSEQMYTALARQGKDVVFLRYWGEWHTLVQPQNQRDMWSRVFNFLKDNFVTPGPKVIH